MQGCITLQRIHVFGARLHVHWSALVAAGLLFGAFASQPIHAAIAVACYFSVILLHEAGHALFAKQLGYRPLNVYLTFIHGLCETEAPDWEKESSTIAWGGVLAQLAVALPLIVVSQLIPAGAVPLFPIVVAILGYMSVLVALMNLAPAKGLDGQEAWKLFPILFSELRARGSAKKAAKEVIRRVK